MTLAEYLKRAREMGRKAIAPPFELGDRGHLTCRVNGVQQWFGSLEGPEYTTEYILTAANEWEKLLKIIEVQEEALDSVYVLSSDAEQDQKIWQARERVAEILEKK